MKKNDSYTVEQHYSVKDLQSLLGISRATVDRLVEKGKLNRVKIGRRSLFKASEINQILQQGAN